MFMLDSKKIERTESKPIRSQTTEMQIGKTTYIVTTTFNEHGRETVQEKFVKLVADRISSEIKSPRAPNLAE